MGKFINLDIDQGLPIGAKPNHRVVGKSVRWSGAHCNSQRGDLTELGRGGALQVNLTDRVLHGSLPG